MNLKSAQRWFGVCLTPRLPPCALLRPVCRVKGRVAQRWVNLIECLRAVALDSSLATSRKCLYSQLKFPCQGFPIFGCNPVPVWHPVVKVCTIVDRVGVRVRHKSIVDLKEHFVNFW